MTPNEATIFGAVGGAVFGAIVGGIVSIVTTRYVLKHGPNYEAQIEGLQDSMGSLARTQEELRKQQAEQAKREEERYETATKQAEAARWKPSAGIITANEGTQHVNKLALSSPEKFKVIEAALLSLTGAKVQDIFVPQPPFNEPATNKEIPILHSALNELAGNSSSYFQFQKFEGIVKYTVEKSEGIPVRVTGEVKFSAGTVILGNTQWYHLVG